MQTVVLTHRLYEDGMRVLNGKVNIKITNNGNPREIQGELGDADAFIIRIGSIDRETILACPKLKVIGRPGVGVDNVDIKTATEKGIPVVIAPGGNTRSVAEHTLTLILAASKNLLISNCRTRAGDFSVRNKYKAFEVLGKTLGLVGFWQHRSRTRQTWRCNRYERECVRSFYRCRYRRSARLHLRTRIRSITCER